MLAIVVTFLGGIAWFGSHALDPYKPQSSEAAPIEVEVVSLDLAVHYVRAGWLERLARGVYCRPNDPPCPPP